MSWHRLSWLFLEQKTDLFNESPKKMLHIAPEMGLMRRFKEISNLDYLTADLHSPQCMVKMDITNIQYPENSFDVIYCSHVLEHLPNDRKAMREFERVLKPNGWAILMVPVTAETTTEDPLETNPAERERRFSRHDHVRRYGLDFAKRLAEEGFKVEVALATQLASVDVIYQMGLSERGTVFFCSKGR
jgi:SAM-dependent methyltransferase